MLWWQDGGHRNHPRPVYPWQKGTAYNKDNTTVELPYDCLDYFMEKSWESYAHL